MSTDFLNRRMDLKHTSLSENYLTMDTSYPVKLAGKVIKIFTASSDFNTNKWILENSDREIILTVESDNVYDFAGRVIKNSIGADKAYSENINVFKQDDYVMVIIDFDNKKIFLCSQTNFSVFITGDNIGDDCKFKLFDITGESEMPGYEYNINEEVFDLAAEFENEEGCHSFVRHSDDDVVYEIPSNQDGTRKMTPVSNVDVFNINSINTAIQNLVFPFINPRSDGGGIDGIDAFHTYRTLNGSVNDKFVSDYCYTYEEIKSLNWDEKGFSHTEIDGLTNPTDYYFVLSSNSDNNDNNTTNKLDDSFMFLPIKKDTLTFASFSEIANGGIICGGEKSIISTKPNAGNNLVGNWWDYDISEGYGVTFHADASASGGSCRVGILKFNGDDYVSGVKAHLYSDWISDNKDTFITRWGINESETYNKDEMKFLNRFLNFFAFNSSYNSSLKHISMTPFNTAMNDSLSVYGGETNRTPFCITAIYPEIFESVLFDTEDGQFSHDNENLSNFTSFYNSFETEEFDRTKYKSGKYDCRNADDDKYLVYALLEKGISKGTMKGSTNSNPTQEIYGLYNPSTYQKIKLKFLSNRSMLGDSYSNYIIGRNSDDSSNYDYIMINLMSKLNVAKINSTFSENDIKDYNTAHIGHESFVVMRRIILPQLKTMCKSGLDHKNFFYDSENDKYFVNYNSNEYEVYTIIYNNGELEFVKLNKEIFKNASKFNGLSDYMYLYFFFISYGSGKKYATIYQMKYYYDTGRDVAQSDEVYVSSKINEKFDFFSVAKLMYTDISSAIDWKKHNRFETGYLNKLVEKGTCNTIEEAINNLKTKFDFSTDISIENMIDSIKDVIIDVVKDYHLFPYFSKDEDDIIITDSVLGKSSAAAITVSHYDNESCHEGIFFASWVNNVRLNDGKGFRLRDMIGDSYSIYQNCMAPYVSNTMIDGAYVYTMESYNKYLKDTYVSDIYFTDEFPFINGIGIRKEYYEGKSLYEFYNYILTRDLSKPMSNPDSLISKIGTNNKVFYSKSTLSNVANVIKNNVSGERLFVDSDNNNITITNGIALHENINPSSIYGFNPDLINNTNSEDVTSEYITDEVIFVNKSEAGKKTIYSLSLEDGNPKIPSLVPLNGTLGEISTDKINWLQLLLALNNNKSIDILSNLSNIKNELNKFFLKASQNVSDKYSIEESISDSDANAHDTIFDESSEYYKDHNADFDETHNIYNFFYGYGYKNRVRELNNRGVIVFVTEGARTLQNITGNQSEVPEDYTYSVTQGKVYPKRMYISKDGLICTKEYYEKENATSDDSTTTIKELQKIIDNLTSTIESLAKSGGMTNFKIMRNKIYSAMNAVLSTHTAAAYKNNDSSWIVDVKSYYRNMQYIYDNIDNYTEEVYDCNCTLNNLLTMHHPNFAKTHTSASDEVFEELDNYNNSFRNAVLAVENLDDKKTKFIESLQAYMNYIVDNLTNDVKDTSPNISGIKSIISDISFE